MSHKTKIQVLKKDIVKANLHSLSFFVLEYWGSHTIRRDRWEAKKNLMSLIVILISCALSLKAKRPNQIPSLSKRVTLSRPESSSYFSRSLRLASCGYGACSFCSQSVRVLL